MLDKDLTTKEFINFIKESIKLREEIKFLFTKNISLSFDYLIKFFKKVGFSRELISFLEWSDIQNIKKNNVDFSSLSIHLRDRQKQYRYKKLINLPPVIRNKDDFFYFEIPDSVPNYVTRKKISAEVIKGDSLDKQDLNGKIVIIPEADPGYDWIFKFNILGLVTLHGGANSHMAIRCAEKSIPAAIGVGKKNYDKILNFKVIELDCENRLLKGKELV